MKKKKNKKKKNKKKTTTTKKQQQQQTHLLVKNILSGAMRYLELCESFCLKLRETVLHLVKDSFHSFI